MLLAAWVHIPDRLLDCIAANLCTEKRNCDRHTQLGVSRREYLSTLDHSTRKGRVILLWLVPRRFTMGF